MKASTRRARKRIGWTAIALVLSLGAIGYVPSLLVFPYRVQIGDVAVHAEAPIDEVQMAKILAAADARVATSALATAPLGPRAIYLTKGGWRWALLTVPTSHGAFGLTRPFSTNIVLNRSTIERDLVENGADIGNRRTLTGTIAHETVHLLIDRRYGGLRAKFFASWRVEGYCDHVAQESSLSDEDAARLRAEGKQPPALAYHDARRRIEAEAAGGAGVDQLLGGP